MKLEIKIFKNLNNYLKFKKLLNDDTLLIENNEQWEDFFSQNTERKNNKNITQNFINKRVLKNIKGFELVIEKTKFNKNITKGYFLDYSSFISIFLYFKNETELLNYVIDTCEARGDKIVNNFNEAINYLTDEGVTIANIINLEINENQWNSFKAKYENLIKSINKQ